MDEYAKVVSSFNAFVQKHNLTRKAAYPTLSQLADDCNPRQSKFGGKIPYLATEECPKCSSCDQSMMMIAQLFIPSLPEFVQSALAPEDRTKLLVLSVCPQCLGQHGSSIRLYSEDQLDSLVYHDDVGESWSKEDHQYARTVGRWFHSPHPFDAFEAQKRWMHFSAIDEWKVCDMVPYMSVEKVKQLLKEDGIEGGQRMTFAAHDFNIKSGVGATAYLGGWPRFCGPDLTPGDDWTLLLSMLESEAASLEWGDSGVAHLWAGTGENSGKFKFTLSSY